MQFILIIEATFIQVLDIFDIDFVFPPPSLIAGLKAILFSETTGT